MRMRAEGKSYPMILAPYRRLCATSLPASPLGLPTLSASSQRQWKRSCLANASPRRKKQARVSQGHVQVVGSSFVPSHATRFRGAQLAVAACVAHAYPCLPLLALASRTVRTAPPEGSSFWGLLSIRTFRPQKIEVAPAFAEATLVQERRELTSGCRLHPW